MEYTKVTMNLNDRSLSNISELDKLMPNANNNTQIVSSALQLSLELLKRVESGSKIILRDKKGNDCELIFSV